MLADMIMSSNGKFTWLELFAICCVQSKDRYWVFFLFASSGCHIDVTPVHNTIQLIS